MFLSAFAPLLYKIILILIARLRFFSGTPNQRTKVHRIKKGWKVSFDFLLYDYSTKKDLNDLFSTKNEVSLMI